MILLVSIHYKIQINNVLIDATSLFIDSYYICIHLLLRHNETKLQHIEPFTSIDENWHKGVRTHKSFEKENLWKFKLFKVLNSRTISPWDLIRWTCYVVNSSDASFKPFHHLFSRILTKVSKILYQYHTNSWIVVYHLKIPDAYHIYFGPISLLCR